jgi:hypothetical protein
LRNLSLGLLLALPFAAGLCHAKSKLERIEVSRGKAHVVSIGGTPAEQINIWNGPGSTMTAADGSSRMSRSERDIADWNAGAVEAPQDLPVFNVRFFCKGRDPARDDAWRCYSVRYVPGRDGERGYIQIPPAGDDDYEANVRTIYRGVEGQWFRASESLEALVRPGIEQAGAVHDTDPVRYTPVYPPVYTPPPQRTAVGARPTVTPKK